jgi:hypothetical protein
MAGRSPSLNIEDSTAPSDVPVIHPAVAEFHLRIRDVVSQFLEREIIAEADLARFDGAIHSAMRLRNSVTAEVVQGAVPLRLSRGESGPVALSGSRPSKCTASDIP